MAALTPLQSVTLSSAAASVTFNNIDQTYTDLQLIVTCTASSSSTNYVNLQFNGDTGGNYSSTALSGNGSSPLTNRWANRVNLTIDYYATPSNTEIGMRKVDIFSYSNSLTYKPIMSRASRAGGGVDAHTGTWRNTAPITSIKINLDSDTFAAGSTFSLYGIRSGGTAKASGGDAIASDGTYWYHAFTKTGVFTPAIPGLSCDVLVVAGGAGGGFAAGAGGGAGGIFYATGQTFSTVPKPVIVGAGGAGGYNTFAVGGSGGNSSIGTLTQAVGGGGGTREAGISGGSGSGTAKGYSPGSSTQTSTGGYGYGYAGGLSNTGADSCASGGGGAGGQAVTPNVSSGSGTTPIGGVGLNTWSSWLTTVGVGGSSGYLADGGSGGMQYGSTVSSNHGAGTGGGRDAAGGSAVAVTGSGGGGGGTGSTGAAGGNGGSGLVIVRYPV